jgi:hypothetical protein
MTHQVGTDAGDDGFFPFIYERIVAGLGGAHLQLVVFDCPVSSTFPLPLPLPLSPIPTGTTSSNPVVQAIPFLFSLEAFSNPPTPAIPCAFRESKSGLPFL